MNGNIRADGGGKRFFDKKNLSRSRLFSGLPDSAFLHLCNTRGNADNDTGPDKGFPLMHLGNKITDHFLDRFEVGNNTIFHGPDRDNITGRSPQHSLCFVSHCKHLAGTCLHSNNRGFT